MSATARLVRPPALSFALILSLLLPHSLLSAEEDAEPGRIGIFGPESNHSVNFTKLINDPQGKGVFARYQVVAAFPKDQPGVESKPGTIPGWDAQMQAMGVELLDSMDDVLRKVDFVMVMTNDGHPHLAHATAAIEAGKPVYVDKPVAAKLVDVVRIYDRAARRKVPIFSSSSLRYGSGAQELRDGSVGRILGADTYSPASLEPTHTDLFWYGIHGVEPLFTVMGPGCRSVRRVHTADFDLVVGTWSDGRIGTVRGTRKGAHTYGGTAFGEKGIAQFGKFEGYDPLVVEILKFFETGAAPVSPAETLEIYAFMEAADESKRRGGAQVPVKDVLEAAQAQANASAEVTGKDTNNE